MIDRHNDKDDSLYITNFNLDNGINVNITSTNHIKGSGVDILLDEPNDLIILTIDLLNTTVPGAASTRYIEASKISQLVTEEHTEVERKKGAIWPNYQ